MPERQGSAQLPLLDRLTDPTPGKRGDREPVAFSIGRLRDCVTRDLSFLFNTTQLSSVEDVLSDADGNSDPSRRLVRQSAINYGVPGLIGLTNAQSKEVERVLARAIADFEPRLVDVRVRFLKPEDGPENTVPLKTLSFSIEAKLAWGDEQEPVQFKTELDPYRGDMTVRAT